MTKSIQRVSIGSAVRILAVIFFLLGSLTAMIGFATVALAPGPITAFTLSGPINFDFTSAPPTWILLAYPFLSAAAGALYAAILAWLYNLLAQLIGGVEITLAD